MAACGTPEPPARATAIDLQPCRLYGGSGLTSVAAECGVLTVPEDPATPGGELIELFVARLPAIAPGHAEAAFTVLAGGPGQAATEFYVDYAGIFERIRRYRDVILVDQRGTGRSNSLDCEFEQSSVLEYSPAAAAAAAGDCLRALPGDPRFYTTSVAVADLERVRAAFGYPLLDIYAASYGTRVGLHYLRRHGTHIRTLTLDGVLPADMQVGPDIALAAQDALEEIFARCRADAECAQRYGELEQRFERVRQRLRAGPVQVELADPLSGETIDVELDYNAFAGAVRLLSYVPETAALLPLVIREADARDNWSPLAAQAQMSLSSVADLLSEGMHNAIVCTEDVPFYAIDASHRERLRETYLGETLVDTLAAVCAVWPAGVLDTDLHEPVVSDAPVLLLSGTADPVTPPANGERAARTLPNSLHLVAEGHGHGVLALPCVPEILAEFVTEASVAELDTGCVAARKPGPFFINFSGPGP